MKTLLRIDASSRTRGSHSRALADFFQQKWQNANPGNEIVLRDLIKDPIPHIGEATIAGYYTPKDEHDDTLKTATALSDQLIDELKSADTLLISTPMYNFSVPSALKAYIDQIVRIGHTFGFDQEKGFYGLVEGKKAFVVTAIGAVYAGALAELNFLEPYLKTLLGFLGITEVEVVSLEGTTTDASALARGKQAAMEKIETLLANGA